MTPTAARVRPAAVAGMFYPGQRDRLGADIDELMAAAAPPSEGVAVPKALVLPHAGYVYSGPVAAAGYARLAPARHTLTNVVLLGPAHRAYVPGVAVSSADAFATPLGPVRVDTTTRDELLALPFVTVDDSAHGPEHCLEVHLPFIQQVLGDVTVLPLLVGPAPIDDVETVLDRVWDGPETVIVVSSDLSHYLDAASARRADRATADAILAADPAGVGTDDACGTFPLRGLLHAARRRDLHIELLALANSSDTAGSPERVVGYGAFALTEASP